MICSKKEDRMTTFQPLQEQAYIAIKKMVDNNELEPNTIYSLTQLAKKMNISRTPLKDALVRLSQDKYVDIIPSKGFCLHKIDEKDIEDTYQIRKAIELSAAFSLMDNQFTSYGRLTLRQMSQCLDEMRQLVGNVERLDDFLQLDIRFHDALVSFLGNENVSDIYASHSYQIRTLAKVSLGTENRMENTCDEHDAIIQAIADNDAGKLYHAIRSHLITTKNLCQTVFDAE